MSFSYVHRQSVLEEQVEAMTVAGRSGDSPWTFNDKLPVVFGTG